MKILSEKKRLNTVMTLAKMAHRDQVDKVGEPYYYHLDRVALNCKSVSAKIVAYLHDIVEEGHITERELWTTGLITEEEMDAILSVTKLKDGQEYHRSYCRDWGGIVGGNMSQIKYNKLAREVKIADITDNMDATRFLRAGKEIMDADIKRFKKYERDLAFLKRSK